MSSTEREKICQEYDIELEQILLDCIDSMESCDCKSLLQNTKDRVCFAKGYLKDLKFIQTFLYFLITGERDIPF